jgi:hypothetical protein
VEIYAPGFSGPSDKRFSSLKLDGFLLQEFLDLVAR